MADWNALVKGFQEGANFSQDFRQRRQIEKARDLGLEGASYDMESRRANRKVRDPMTKSVFGDLDPGSVKDWNGALPDPFAFKLFDWIKSKSKKKKKALDVGEVAPTGVVSQTGADRAAAPPQAETPEEMTVDAQAYPSEPTEEQASVGYADGGEIDDAVKQRASQYRARTPGSVQNATESVMGADRTATAGLRGVTDAVKQADAKIGKFLSRAGQDAGALSKVGAALKRTGALGALASTALESGSTPTEQYRKRFALETDEPSLAGDLGVRALGAASDLGNVLTGGLAGRFYRDKEESAAAPAPAAETPPAQAPQRMALPAMQVSARPPQRKAAVQEAHPDVADFSNLEIEPHDVPDMKTDDWKQYRAEVMDAARLSGNPEAVSRANDMVTEMQQKGFLSYGKQGLALQQAGNTKAAMAAYRAAYQYFPNGHDVEFALHKNQIVGVGKDEKTGKVVPGTAMVMDPERVSALMENFTNPQAFRMWTKDWRDFQQGQRQYSEVTKPLAQANIQHLATSGEADIIRAQADVARAENAGGAAASGAGMRNAEHVFRQRVEMLGIQDEAQADFLASVMSRVKQANPKVPDNTIVQAIMQAQHDGTLQQRLGQMGIH